MGILEILKGKKSSKDNKNKQAQEQHTFVQSNQSIKMNTQISEYNRTTMSTANANNYLRNVNTIANRDEYFVAAGRFIIEKNKASVGILQRAFKIGFNRATRILNELYDAGVVGGDRESLKLDVLMSLDEFYAMLEENVNFNGSQQHSDHENTYSQSMDNRIRMYNNKFDYMEGHDFEYYCAGLLRENGFSSVDVTKGSGDQGIDIIAINGGVKYGIQCKCYNSDIGNKAVQEAYSGARFYDCHVPVVITNQHFTNAARELAEKTGVLLWDREYLIKLVQNSNSSDNAPEHYNASRKHIIHITEKNTSFRLFTQLRQHAENTVYRYIEQETENDLEKDVNKSVNFPIRFYFASVHFPVEALIFNFCAQIKPEYYQTSSYKKDVEIRKGKFREKEKIDLFEIQVLYGMDDLYFDGRNLTIIKSPEVNIFPATLGEIKLSYEKVADEIRDNKYTNGDEDFINESSIYLKGLVDVN